MSDEIRPSAALINREWFESASRVLTPNELGLLLLEAVHYVLNGKEPDRLAGTASVVFAMIRPALDSDISRYRERCARNAANAKSKRVAASGSEWQPVGASGEQQQPQQQQQQQPQPQSLSQDDEKQIEKDKFMVWGYMWSIGSSAIKEECAAFWSYYEALGWRNNKGAQIVSRLAAARMWRRQYETRTPPNGAAQWFQAFKDCPILDYAVFNAYAGAEYSADEKGVLEVRLRANEAYLNDMREKVPQCIEQFRRLCKADKVVLLPLLGQ